MAWKRSRVRVPVAPPSAFEKINALSSGDILDQMKAILKNFVVLLLGWQVRRLYNKHQFKTIGVVGSIGKTSTKMAIAQTLGKNLRVRYQEGNYNDIVSVPLIYFGQTMPSLINPFAWAKIFANNQRQLAAEYPYDVVVLELGTDAPGQIAAFKKYVRLDLAVVTAITPEHMEYFTDLDAVAQEELSVHDYAQKVIYNSDLVPEKYRSELPDGSLSYSISSTTSDFYMANMLNSTSGFSGDVKHGGEIILHVTQDVLSELQFYSLLAAIIVCRELGLSSTQILAGLSHISPVSGRLRRLRGINYSTIIDDTYNASPDAVKAGLQALYKIDAPKKIAVLGNMNELGAMSEEAHKQIGDMCDPAQLSQIITIGKDANAHLASAAEAKGCRVRRFDSPYLAGEYLQKEIEPNTLIFAKGSQNGVFAEEVIKLILADPEDKTKLVRQSPEWLAKKRKAFGING
jgi:UDP-N-acetylmuramoyl-tripeptide--D-alanyl-D-alanine ligase